MKIIAAIAPLEPNRRMNLVMRLFSEFLILIFFAVLSHSAWSDQNIPDKEKFRPPLKKIQEIVALLPAEYKKGLLSALRKSGKNAWQFIHALENTSFQQREALAFLITNMPGRDLVALKGDFLIQNDALAYQAISEVPWGKQIPKEIFLNDVLPYAILNERRDSWREDFYQRFIKIASTSKSIDQAVLALNKYVFDTLGVSYSATRRPKPDQSPYESIQVHYASCTGLSILLTDALRSVGIPSRIAAIPMWPDESGNHTWVEIWDGHWHYIGAAEPTPLDHTWFTVKASHTDVRHPIYATSFKKTLLRFPMRWAPDLKYVFAENVTGDYKR